MNLIKRLGAFPQTHQQSGVRLFTVALIGSLLAGCGGSSDSADAVGYFKFYNASSNSPAIYASLDDRDYPGISFSQSTNLYELDNTSYELSLAYKEGSDDYYTLVEQEVQITNGEIDLLVLGGDIDNQQVLSVEFV
jgi:hypothetical protein